MSEPANLKVALITGANKGIGFEVARQLGALGWHILLGARDQNRGLAAAEKLKGQGIDVQFEQLDVSDECSIAAAARRIASDFGRLDVLVNNAGLLLEGNFSRSGRAAEDFPSQPSVTGLDVVKRTYATNVFGAIAVTNAMLPLLRRSYRARVVNVSSKFASLNLADEFCHGRNKDRYLNLLAYNSSKAALNAVTLQFAIELRETGIKVNAADPGHAATDINGRHGERKPSDAAKVIVQLALLPDLGPTGTFVANDGPRPW
jgi:NAD(P)-dependent dehydrogenase (short-subunit alcohol dehydrogenase family)